MEAVVRRHLRKGVAIVLIAVAGAAARLPVPSAAERDRVAYRFRFERHPLGDPLARTNARGIRTVHPSLSHIAAWISSVGASVALNDLDGDGLANDSCLVDPRTDRIVISPVDRPERYRPFAIPLPARLFDPSTMAPMGCTPGDLNEDGLIDLIVYFWGRTPLMLLRRAGPIGSDAYDVRPLVDTDERWYTNALTRADLDGDGHVDIVVANYFPDGAAVLDGRGSEPQTMQASMSRARNGGRKHVFLWAGVRDGQPPEVLFRRVDDALPPEVNGTWTLALGAADLNRDLRPELYFANDFGPDQLLYNDSVPGHPRFHLLRGRRTLMTAASKVLGRDSFKGMGVDFGDLNHDGRPDIFVSNIGSQFALEESHFLFLSTGDDDLMRKGIAPYVDRSERLGVSRSGWGWDVKLDDFDNDGELEIVQATGFVRGSVSRWPELHELASGNDQLLADPRSWPRFRAGTDLSGGDGNPFFVRFADGRYYDVAANVGLTETAVSRGIAVADVDGDGRLDLAIANQWQESAFFANRATNPGAFLGLRLLRPLDPNASFSVEDGLAGVALRGTPAIGAVARVHLPRPVWLSREVDGGNGHSGKRSSDLHFGLGQVRPDVPLDVVLSWRDSRGQLRSRQVELKPGWHTVLLGT
jgi:hypothetical protein